MSVLPSRAPSNLVAKEHLELRHIVSQGVIYFVVWSDFLVECHVKVYFSSKVHNKTITLPATHCFTSNTSHSMSDSEGSNQSGLGMNDMMYFMSGSAEADEDDSKEAHRNEMMYFMSGSAEADEDDSKEAHRKWNIVRNRDKVHPLWRDFSILST
jgi:hypothetical protein